MQRAVWYQDAPSAHQFQFKWTLHQQGGLWGGPAYWVLLLLGVFFRIVQRAAQHGMQVLVVRLDYVECGASMADHCYCCREMWRIAAVFLEADGSRMRMKKVVSTWS